MRVSDPARALTARCSVVFTLTLALSWLAASPVHAQSVVNSRAVGGISIDASGLLDNATLDAMGELRRLRAEAMDNVPEGLNQANPTRKVSLRGLQQAIAEHAEDDRLLPDEVRYLAGLQRIEYVFVYPELNDIVLVGPGEGWQVDQRGYVVGSTTGRPVMLLDDLLVAMRTARQAARGGISCSIDPTPEGLTRLRSHVSKLRTIGNPQRTAAGIENALGRQQITVTGVPETSHFARVMVAADYRMKRLAMHFEPAPVAGLPSFLSMMRAGGRGMSNMMPRWWLAPNYEPLLRDADGLAWAFPSASVKAMTEADFLTAAGTREHSGQASPVAQKWADNMTEHFDELAVADPVFGQLRNCMELAVVSALMVKEDLPGKAGCSLPTLLDGQGIDVEKFPAPKEVDSKASLLKKGRNWLISASGGVQINSWMLADKTEQSDSLDPLREKAKAAGQNGSWWWQ
jgi:hypothetical protein